MQLTFALHRILYRDHTALTEFSENLELVHSGPQRGKEVRAGFIRPILLRKKLGPKEDLYLAGSLFYFVLSSFPSMVALRTRGQFHGVRRRRVMEEAVAASVCTIVSLVQNRPSQQELP